MRIEEWLRAGAARHGVQAVLVAERGRRSYAELDRKTERLAAALQTGGVARGVAVALFMDDGWEALVSFFAVAKAGGIAVPVASGTSAGELAGVLADSRPLAVVTQARLAAAVAAAIAPVRSIRLVVLAGGDRTRGGGTCIPFEDVVERVGPVPPLAAAGDDSDVAVLVDGDALSHRRIVDEAARAAVTADGMILPPLAERSGIVRLLAAIAAGRSMVACRTLAAEGGYRSAAAWPVNASFALSDRATADSFQR